MTELEAMVAIVHAREVVACVCAIVAFLILYCCSNFWPLALLLVLGAIDMGAVSYKHSPDVCPHCGKVIQSEQVQDTVKQPDIHPTNSGTQK